jgi:predicted signal transduction protein with EAL and GGDEF domain
VSRRETVLRCGDDEFVVICEDTGEHSAYSLACFLRNTLAEPFRIDGAAVHVTASIGVAASPADEGVSAMDLLRHADTAVHAAKAAGRGQVHVYDRTLGEDEADRYALAADLPAALAGKALHVEYQRIVDLGTRAVVGLEALARWTHPERGPVPPSSFVGVAELTGMAPELDRWVVQQALQDMARLREAGAVPPDAYLAVNLSAANLTDPYLVDHLATWIERSGLPAELLVLEITETALMQDPSLATRLLRRLRGRGYRVSMDDFGTGYSSLAHLRDLPISALKIDRSFVAEIGGQPDALAIVAWVIELAGAVGVAVVAEGVETEEQAELLRGLGCRTAQGWLWGPALPVTTLLDGTGSHSVGPESARPATPGHGKREVPDAHGIERMLELHRGGTTIDAIAADLDAAGFRTPTGRRWRPARVARVISERIRRSAGTSDDGADARRPLWPVGSVSRPAVRFSSIAGLDAWRPPGWATPAPPGSDVGTGGVAGSLPRVFPGY